MFSLQVITSGRHGCDRIVVIFTTTLYLCNQRLSPDTTNLVSSNPVQAWVHDTTLCDKVYQLHAADLWFSLGTPVSSTNKPEILLKVALNTINHKPSHHSSD